MSSSSSSSNKGSLNDPLVIHSEDEDVAVECEDEHDVEIVDGEMASSHPKNAMDGHAPEKRPTDCVVEKPSIPPMSETASFSPTSQMESIRELAKRRWAAAKEDNDSKKARNDPQDSVEMPIKILTSDEPCPNINCLEYRQHSRTMRQLLGLEQGVDEYIGSTVTIDWMVVANYMIDFDFILDTMPELMSIPDTVVFYGSGSDTNCWTRMNPSVTFVPMVPSDPPSSPTNPLNFRVPWGVHHTKLFFLGLSSGKLRVIIHTANLVHGDIHLKTQAAYMQDFDLKRTDSTSCDFEHDLVAYLQTYNHHKPLVGEKSLIQEIQRYDFSTSKVMLVSSTPGRHKLDHQPKMGYLQLSSLIRKHVPRRNISTPIVCQFSSIGSLSQKWLAEIAQKWDAAADVHTGDTKGDWIKERLKLVYPTVDEIRNSVEGYRGGGSVPGRSNNASKAFLRPLYHKWTSMESINDIGRLHRPTNVPHIKTYYQLTPEFDGMEWFCLSSHNLSKAAWGEVIYTNGGRRIFTRHWELGVFLCPQMLGGDDSYKLLPVGTANGSKSIGVPLPYSLQPTKYGMMDQPWTVDKVYTDPDRFGRTSV